MGVLWKCADPHRVAQQEDNPIAKRNSEDNWDYSPIDQLLPMDRWMMIIMHLMGQLQLQLLISFSTAALGTFLYNPPAERRLGHSFVCAFPPAQGPCYIWLVTRSVSELRVAGPPVSLPPSRIVHLLCPLSCPVLSCAGCASDRWHELEHLVRVIESFCEYSLTPLSRPQNGPTDLVGTHLSNWIRQMRGTTECFDPEAQHQTFKSEYYANTRMWHSHYCVLSSTTSSAAAAAVGSDKTQGGKNSVYNCFCRPHPLWQQFACRSWIVDKSRAVVIFPVSLICCST